MIHLYDQAIKATTGICGQYNEGDKLVDFSTEGTREAAWAAVTCPECLKEKPEPVWDRPMIL